MVFMEKKIGLKFLTFDSMTARKNNLFFFALENVIETLFDSHKPGTSLKILV